MLLPNPPIEPWNPDSGESIMDWRERANQMFLTSKKAQLSMTPNDLLTTQLDMAGYIDADGYPVDATKFEFQAHRLAQAVLDLNCSIIQGGPLPDAWEQNRVWMDDEEHDLICDSVRALAENCQDMAIRYLSRREFYMDKAKKLFALLQKLESKVRNGT